MPTHNSTDRSSHESTLGTEGTERRLHKFGDVDRSTASVVHDFDNLLAAIQGGVSLLRRPGLCDDNRRRYLEAIGDAADRAARLSRQLLARARRQSPTPEIFDAVESVQQIGNVAAALVSPETAVVIEIEPGDHLVRTDRSQLENAIINLVINARDAMKHGGLMKIKVSAQPGIPWVRFNPARSGEFVAIAVGDNGTGIAPDVIDCIFDPFFTTKGSAGGTGLGLPQVFSFAKQSGGEIVVDTVEGEGSIFTIFLPLCLEREWTARSTVLANAER